MHHLRKNEGREREKIWKIISNFIEEENVAGIILQVGELMRMGEGHSDPEYQRNPPEYFFQLNFPEYPIYFRIVLHFGGFPHLHPKIQQGHRGT